MLSFYWVLDAGVWLHYNFDKFFKRSVNHFFSTDLFFESLGKQFLRLAVDQAKLPPSFQF